MVLKIVFWINIIIVTYVYFGYFFILKFLTLVFKKKNFPKLKKIQNYPLISVIIAAYNEEKTIKKRIENLLQQDYPKNKMEIIVASNGLTDRIVEIAKQFEKYGVRV